MHDSTTEDTKMLLDDMAWPPEDASATDGPGPAGEGSVPVLLSQPQLKTSVPIDAFARLAALPDREPAG